MYHTSMRFRPRVPLVERNGVCFSLSEVLESASICREISCVLSVFVVVLLQWVHWTVEAIWPWNLCEMGSLTSLIKAISSSWASAGSPSL